MLPLTRLRLGDYLLLVLLGAGMFLPGLGSASLWDIDEGNNATCAREMLEAGNWVRPTFNYELRVDKPALLYWLQIQAYQLFGIGEFSARLPSALAALLTLLLTYELGRRMFDRGSGLLAGIVLASALLFCGSAHFANPDELLIASTVLTLMGFWLAYQRAQPAWLALAGLAMALGMLAKGPVAIVLPWATVLVFAAWSRQWRWLLQFRWLFVAGLIFLIVALPWYALVGAATRGEFLEGFFLKHNVDRFQTPLEGHRGPLFYHLITLLVGFMPWSAFLGPTLWFAVKDMRQPAAPASAAQRFLLAWLTVWLVFFSLSGTKLPNYLLPAYPAAALLTGRFLQRWRMNEVAPARWVLAGSLATWACCGISSCLAMLIASGLLPIGRMAGHELPQLQAGAPIGALLLLGAGLAWLAYRRQQRELALASLAGSAALFVGIFYAWGAPALDAYKAPRPLVAAAAACQRDQDVRIGCYQWYQPSLVFYSQRRVQQLHSEKKALEFLQHPLPVYLYLPASVWTELQGRLDVPCQLLARHWDLYRKCEVVVVTNR